MVRTAPVIVELAVNGATPRSTNPHVPRTPAEITAAAVDGVERGASIVHNHHDEPMFALDGVLALIDRLGLAPATPAEARRLLGVPG